MAKDAYDGDGSDNKGWDEDNVVSLGANPVVICVHQSMALQLKMNNACWGHGRTNKSPNIVPLILVGTAGVHVRLFCNFGPGFIIINFTPDIVASKMVKQARAAWDSILYIAKISSIISQISNFSSSSFSGTEPPQRIKLQRASLITDTSSTIATSLLERKARSFAWIKLTNQIAFLSLREILRPNNEVGSVMTPSSNCWNDKTLFAPSDLNKSFDPIRWRAVIFSMIAWNYCNQWCANWQRVMTIFWQALSKETRTLLNLSKLVK